MAREILFKAKRIDNGEWVMGGSIIQFLDDGVRSFYMPQFNEKCICKHDEVTDDILEFQNTRFYKVDGATICQYTGLTDKNGNKIWENDVCVCKKRGCAFFGCVVKWNQVKARFDVNAMSFDFPMTLEECIDGISINGLDYEVIGNIFDKPELLRGCR